MIGLSGSSRRTGAARGFAYRAAHVIVPLGIVGLVVHAVGAGDVLASLRGAEPDWIVLALMACSAQILLCAMRWQVTARSLGTTIPVRSAVSEYYLSSVINTTVPGGVVGDAMRAARARGAAGLERAVHSVVIERLAGQIGLGAVLLLGLALSGRPVLQGSAAIAALALLALGAAYALLRERRLARFVPPVIRRFATAIRMSWFDGRTALVQIALSLAIVAANLAAFAFAARATGTAIGFPEMLFAIPLILAAMLIPFSVAGWGYREGAAAAIFPLLGTSAAAGVSASLVFGAVILAASLPGTVVVLFRNRLSRPATEHPGDAAE
ncbi:MAG: lysylphosphatidylglycerol synthase transmembrane domain-containing protein [Rubricella sp.]